MFAGLSDVAGSSEPVGIAIVAFDPARERELYRLSVGPARRCDGITLAGTLLATTVHDDRGVSLVCFDRPSRRPVLNELLHDRGRYENSGLRARTERASNGYFVSWAFEEADGSPRVGETQLRDLQGSIVWSAPGYAKLATPEAVIIEDPDGPTWAQRGIDPETGRELWRKQIREPFFFGVTGGHVITGPDSLRGPLRGIDPWTGEVAWTAELGGIISSIQAFPGVALAVSTTDSGRVRLHRIAPGGEETASGTLEGPAGEMRASVYEADGESVAWLAERGGPVEMVCESLAEPGAILWRIPVSSFSVAFGVRWIAAQSGPTVRVYRGDS